MSQSPAATPDETAKVLALVAWMSAFTGMPLFLVPMLTGDSEYAKFHGKHAAAHFIATIVVGVVSLMLFTLSCFIFFPILIFPLLMWVPAIQGAVLALTGERKPPMFTGWMTERLFGSLALPEGGDE